MLFRSLIPAEEENFIKTILWNSKESIELKTARLVHGHNFNWLNPQAMVWYPEFTKLPDKNIIYGHNHQNAIFEVKITMNKIFYIPIEIIYGMPIYLNNKSKYLINVGDIKNPYPSWMLYDENEMTLIYNRLARNKCWNGGRYE